MTPSTVDGVEVYRFRLTLETPLSVGVGGRGFVREMLRVPISTQTGVIRVPIIPATTIKGALRGMAESLGRSIGMKSRDRGDIWLELMAAHEREGGLIRHDLMEPVLREIKSRLPSEGFTDRDVEAVNGEFPSLICPICRLFGAPGLAGALRLSDAIPTTLELPTASVTRVALDRRKLKAAERRLFTEEVLLPGHEFRGIIVLDQRGFVGTETARRVKWLFELTLQAAREMGFQLGGGRSVGRGLVRIELESEVE